MAISGIGSNYNNMYGNIYAAQKNEAAKKTGTGDIASARAEEKDTTAASTEKAKAKDATAASTEKAKVKDSASTQVEKAKNTATNSVSDYYSYLQKNYDCVKEGKVSISGSYLRECAKNPEKAKELEENLSYFKEGYEKGLKSAQANAKAMGARLVDYSESWSIDSKGNVTMMASSTIVTENGAKGWKKLAEEREDKLKEKKKQERIEEKKKKQKEQKEERLEKIQISAQSASAISNAYHKPVDIKA